MYLVTNGAPVTSRPMGAAEPRNVVLVGLALGAVGLAAWSLFFARKRKLHIRGCKRGAGPRLHHVHRITTRGGLAAAKEKP